MLDIAFDAVSNGAAAAASSVTFAHTCTGQYRLLLVWVKCYNAGVASDKVTGVTYGGVAMTLIRKKQQGIDDTRYLYGLVAPAQGANNVVITASASVADLGAISASYTNAFQSSVPTISNDGVSTSPLNISNTTLVDRSWLAGGMATDNGASVSAGTGTTSRYNYTSRGNFIDSNGVKTPVGSYALQGTSASGNIIGIVCVIEPVIVTSGESEMCFDDGLAIA